MYQKYTLVQLRLKILSWWYRRNLKLKVGLVCLMNYQHNSEIYSSWWYHRNLKLKVGLVCLIYQHISEIYTASYRKYSQSQYRKQRFSNRRFYCIESCQNHNFSLCFHFELETHSKKWRLNNKTRLGNQCKGFAIEVCAHFIHSRLWWWCEYRHKSIRKRSFFFLVSLIFMLLCYYNYVLMSGCSHSKHNDITSFWCRYVYVVMSVVWTRHNLYMLSVTFALLLQGLGTDEGVLIEILCTRSNAEINAIKQSYQRRELGLNYNRHLTQLSTNCNKWSLLRPFSRLCWGICSIFPVRHSVRSKRTRKRSFLKTLSRLRYFPGRVFEFLRRKSKMTNYFFVFRFFLCSMDAGLYIKAGLICKHREKKIVAIVGIVSVSLWWFVPQCSAETWRRTYQETPQAILRNFSLLFFRYSSNCQVLVLQGK